MRLLALWIFILFTGFEAHETHAAQYGRIVVDIAKVLQFPQAKANIIDRVQKDDVLVTSNKPIEGFYKVRTFKGELGWVSGNDIFVSEAPPNSDVVADDTNQEKAEEKVLEKIDEEDKKNQLDETHRIILAGGLSNLSYEGIPSELNPKNLNLGLNGLIELQFKLSRLIYWAIRTEIYSASSGNIAISGGTQKVDYFSLPVMLGLQFSVITAKSFRLGWGTYAGLSPLSSLHVVQSTTTAENDVTFSSMDLCGTLAMQMNIGIGAHAGLFFEAAYRYQKTSDFSPSTKLNLSTFKADYSGVVGQMGIEFRI